MLFTAFSKSNGGGLLTFKNRADYIIQQLKKKTITKNKQKNNDGKSLIIGKVTNTPSKQTHPFWKQT